MSKRARVFADLKCRCAHVSAHALTHMNARMHTCTEINMYGELNMFLLIIHSFVHAPWLSTSCVCVYVCLLRERNSEKLKKNEYVHIFYAYVQSLCWPINRNIMCAVWVCACVSVCRIIYTVCMHEALAVEQFVILSRKLWYCWRSDIS